MDNSLVVFDEIGSKKKKRSNKSINSIVQTELWDEEKEELFFRGIAENISIEIGRKGCSITNLADLANISTTHLFRVLKGEVRIGLKALFSISLVLGKDPSYFLPTSIQNLQTNGQIYDEITKEMDTTSNNALLNIVAAWVKEWKRISR